jgi:RNA polymerase sigma-70 factor (ECF subfamily)
MELPEKEPVPEDDRLVARARLGDAEAFDGLVRLHAAWAHRFALRLLGDRHLAEDATQEAFLRVYRSIGSFRGQSGFRTYLYRVVLNCCRDHASGKRRRAETLRTLAESAGPPDRCLGDPVESLRAREFHQRVRSLVDRLPPAQRETLILRAYEGLRYDEIAGVLGVSVHAVKGNLAEARSKVASRIGDRGVPPRRRADEDG